LILKLNNEIGPQVTLDTISELSSTGSDVISGAELNQLQTDGRRLKVSHVIIFNVGQIGK
jgi:hypothetical protein